MYNGDDSQASESLCGIDTPVMHPWLNDYPVLSVV